jgi:hypothetical protein
MFLGTLWSWRSLLVLSPALAGLELGMLLLSAKQGWFGGKLRSYGWLLKHAGHIRRRRRQLRRERAVPDKVWMTRLTDQLDATAIELPAVVGPLNAVMRGYWRAARKLV